MFEYKFFKFLNMIEYFSKEKTNQVTKYGLQDFIFRWKKLERIVVKENLDGLLLITGPNSADSISSAYLFNWLFLGLSGISIHSNQYLDPIYSEIILLMSPTKNTIFITPEARSKLQNLIYGIPNIKIITPTTSQYANKEILDILKIQTFYQSLQKLKKIGVFLKNNQEPKIVIEKWPLIQSYALEQIGKTFFTMAFQVSNIGEKVEALFKNFDKYFLKKLATETAYSLEGHFKGSTKILQLTNKPDRGTISERIIQQNLQETVEIDTESSGSKSGLVPKVIFGSRTGNKDNVSINEATIQSQNAIHANIEHFDPYTKLKIWRTYFVTSINQQNQVIKQVSCEDQKKSEDEQSNIVTKYVCEMQENKQFSDGNILIQLYTGLIQGVVDSISTVSKDYRNLNKQFLESSIFGRLKGVIAAVYGDERIKSQNLEVELESFDSFGDARPIDFKDSISFKLTSTFYIIKARLNGIVSIDKSRKLGAVIFSEAFLLQEGCFLLLTKNIPYFQFCDCKQDGLSQLGHLNPNYKFQKLGSLVTEEGFKARIFIPCQRLSTYRVNIPLLAIKMYFHQNGIRLYNDKFGWRYLEYSSLKDLTMVNKISGEWVLMKLNQSFLFQPLETNIIAIEFRGKPFQHLLSKMNAKENPLQISFLDVIPPVLAENWYFTSQVLKKDVKEGGLMHQHQILQNQFLWDFIEAKQLMILNQMKDLKFNGFKTIYQQRVFDISSPGISDANKNNILIINGTYGSSKLRLAESLKKFGPNNIKTHIFNVPSENLYGKMEVPTFFKIIQEFIENNEIPSSNDTVLIVVVPSWLDCSEFLLLAQPHFNIRGIVSMASAGNFFTNNSQLVENVTTFMFPGYSQYIVIDTYGEDQNVINEVMKVVWNINPQGKVLRCTNTMLTTAQCKDILEQNTFNNEFNKFLRGKYSVFYKFDELKQLSVNYIEFKLPIESLSQIKRLTKQKGYIFDEKKIYDELKVKREEAQKSQDQLMNELYKIQEGLTILKRRQKATRIRSFKGILRLSGEEGQAHISWANQLYRQKIIVNQDRQLGVSILATNYDELEVRKFLENLTQKKQIMQKLKTLKKIQDLTEEERKIIIKQGRTKYLENGQFFDGYFYRDVEGHVLENHPQFQRLLQQWVQQFNKQIINHNNQVKAQWTKYTETYK